MTLEGVKDNTYDILIVSNGVEKAGKKKELPKGVKGNPKVCDVKWLKQVIVSDFIKPSSVWVAMLTFSDFLCLSASPNLHLLSAIEAGSRSRVTNLFWDFWLFCDSFDFCLYVA